MALTLSVYDSSGLLVFSGPAGQALSLADGFNVSADPWDPGQGPLMLSAGDWSHAYEGRDNSGAVLRNGVYLLVLRATDGQTSQKTLRVLGRGTGLVSLRAGPNPVGPTAPEVRLVWSPIAALELKIYSLDGQLVRDFGLEAVPPLAWDLRNSGGKIVAGGVYVVVARLPGERHPQFFKLRVVR